MMLARIRRDDVWRTFPMWGVILILNTGVVTGLLAAIVRRQGHAVSPSTIVLLLWGTVAVYLALGHTGSRCSVFDLTLPISARRIWLAHLSAVAAATTIVAAGCTAIVLVAARSLGGAIAPGTGPWSLALLVESAALLGVVLLELPQPSLARVPASAGRAAWSVAVIGGVLALLLLLSGAGAPGALVPAGLAAVALAWRYRSLPTAFALAPREPAAKRAADTFRRETADDGSRLTPWRQGLVVLRCLWIGPKELAFYPFIVLFGLFFGNALSAWSGEAEVRDLRFLYVPMATYMLFSFVAPKLAPLHRLDPLPISRRLIFAGLIVPLTLVLVASYGAGAFVAAWFGAPAEYVNFVMDAESGRFAVSVPLRVHEVAWDGRVPEVTSPWGESHPAERLSLFRGSRALLWNPFSAPEGSSPRFTALQISRAVQAVYGASIAPETIEARWIETLSDGTVVGRGPSLSIRSENPGLLPRSGPLFPMILALAVTPWLLASALLFRAYRAEIRDRVRVSIYWGGLVVIISVFLSQAVALVTGFARPWLARALVEIPAWKLGGGAVGIASAWIAAGVVMAAAYRLAEAQFLRMEIPLRPAKYSLLERLQRSD